MGNVNTKRKPRFWHGGVCSCGPIILTHPIDLLKVQLQTQTKKTSAKEVIATIHKHQGVIGFYHGLSASLYWQLTYSMVRFGVYDAGKQFMGLESFASRSLLAVIAGVLAGLGGVPGNVITVRMQTDAKLPINQRRYKNALEGLYRIYKDEGGAALYRGTAGACLRSATLVFGLNAIYDEIKTAFLTHTTMDDDVPLHLVSSTLAGSFATLISQPIDVVTTVYMNSKSDEIKGLVDAARQTFKIGPMAFYKGSLPMLFRILPNSVLTFIIYEQTRLRFGWLPEEN